MSSDPYEKWLGIEPGKRPPNLYDLLLLPLFCDDSSKVEEAARTQMRKARVYQAHPDHEERKTCHRMLREIAAARVCLVAEEKKREYDARLSHELNVEPTPVAAVEPTAESKTQHRTRRERAKVTR